jgi:hypothetical protein
MHTMKLECICISRHVDSECLVHMDVHCAYVHAWICIWHACGLRIVCCYIHAIMML